MSAMKTVEPMETVIVLHEVPNAETLAAFAETEEMLKHPETIKSYKSIEEMMKALEEDDEDV